MGKSAQGCVIYIVVYYIEYSLFHPFRKRWTQLTRLESHTPTSAKSLQPSRHLIGRQIAFNFAHRLACKSTHLFSHSAPPSNMCIRVVDLQLTPGKHVVYSSTIYDGIHPPPWGCFPGSIALRPRGRQYRTIRLRKASSRRGDSNAHFFGTDPICGDLDHGKSAQGCVIYFAVCGSSFWSLASKASLRIFERCVCVCLCIRVPLENSESTA